MKKILSFLIAALVWASPALAQKEAIQAEPAHDWLTYYYMDKDTAKARVPDYLKKLEESRFLEKDPAAMPRIEAFLSVVFADNAASAKAWIKDASLTGKTKAAVEEAVAHPVTPQSLALKTLPDIEKAWGAYYASGDTAYISKVIDLLDKSVKLSGDLKADDGIRTAAAISLGFNMTEHESVDRFLRSESAKRTGSAAEALKHIMDNVEAQRSSRAFPDHNGEFTATLLVTDPAVTGKELAHMTNVLQLKESRRARVGDKRAFLIFFAGQQLSQDYLSDVTYDVQLIDPAGKVYLDQKDLEGMKQKTPTRFRLFNTKAVVSIAFDAKDKKGIYKIYVTMKDNIGKKTIPLMSKILFAK